MRSSLPRLVALAALAGGALAGAPARAGAPVRLVEAFADPGFDRRAVLQVTASSPRQKADPDYNVMASLLGDALAKARLNIHQDAVSPDVYVLFEYRAMSIPFFRRAESSVSDPSYRAMVVTAVRAEPWKTEGRLDVLWQTVVDQTGISNNPEQTIPRLVEASARWYGRNVTPKGLNAASSCAPGNAATTGTRIGGFCSDFLTPQALPGGGRIGATVGGGGIAP